MIILILVFVIFGVPLLVNYVNNQLEEAKLPKYKVGDIVYISFINDNNLTFSVKITGVNKDYYKYKFFDLGEERILKRKDFERMYTKL